MPPRTDHVPHRRCVGCGAVRPKADLLRLALADGARVVQDPGATLPGRGAYVCGRDCTARALSRRALPRAFRSAVQADDSLVDCRN